MSWNRAEIEQQVEREPRLGIALSQYLVRECIELQDRIESMAVHKTPERVMLALLQLATDLGSSTPDGGPRAWHRSPITLSRSSRGDIARDRDLPDEPAAPPGA